MKPRIVGIIGHAAAVGLTAYGFRMATEWRRLLSVTVRDASAEEFSPQDVRMLRGLITFTYAGAVMGIFIGGIQMLATLDRPSQIGGSIAIALVTVFYALVIAELILRPALRRIEWLLHDGGRHDQPPD